MGMTLGPGGMPVPLGVPPPPGLLLPPGGQMMHPQHGSLMGPVPQPVNSPFATGGNIHHNLF